MVSQEVIDKAWKLIHAGEFDSAISFLNEQIDQTGGDAELLRLIGESHIQAGRSEQAYKVFQRSLQFEPNSPVANYGMALISHAARNLSDACVRYKSGMEGGIPSRLCDCENIVLAFAAAGDKRTALWIAQNIGKIHPSYKARLETFARSINGFDPDGGAMGLIGVNPIHGGMSDPERKAAESLRDFVAEYGAGKKKKFLGGLFR
jgi:tetratricopeptide (TPR) repeat protein